MSKSNSTTKFPEWSPVSVISSEHAEIYARLFKSLFPILAEKANGRIEKAVGIMSRAGARRLDRTTGLYEVESESGRGWYQVDLESKTCTCPDAQYCNLCKHRLAIGLQIQGHDWLLEWQHDHFSRVYDLKKQVDAAWRRSNGLASTYEDSDPDSPYLDERRARMFAAVDEAQNLQMQLNALIVEKP